MRILNSFTALLLCSSIVLAQEKESKPLDWQAGPSIGKMASISSIKLPEGYQFLGPEDTKLYTEASGNIATGQEIGLIINPDTDLIAYFDFNPIGYVKDDEKDQLDPVKMLKSHQEGQERANEVLRARGLRELEVIDWVKEPFYNEETQNLEWCLSLRAKGSDRIFANHNIRILGRHGVTKIVVPAGVDELETLIPELATLLEGYEYQTGNRYAEFTKGDKIAKYGLTALVAGGAAAAALKSGMLKPLLKGLGIAAIAITSFFRKIFGRKKEDD